MPAELVGSTSADEFPLLNVQMVAWADMHAQQTMMIPNNVSLNMLRMKSINTYTMPYNASSSSPHLSNEGTCLIAFGTQRAEPPDELPEPEEPAPPPVVMEVVTEEVAKPEPAPQPKTRKPRAPKAGAKGARRKPSTRRKTKETTEGEGE